MVKMINVAAHPRRIVTAAGIGLTAALRSEQSGHRTFARPVQDVPMFNRPTVTIAGDIDHDGVPDLHHGDRGERTTGPWCPAVIPLALASLLAGDVPIGVGQPIHALPKYPPPEDVVDLLKSDTPNQIAEVVAMVERLFPALEQLIDDPQTHGDTVRSAFFFLGQMKKVDHSRFFDRALDRLGHTDHHMRHSAVDFLGATGGEKEAGPLAILLLDDYSTVRLAVARALSKIGGKQEVVTFNLIIKNAGRYRDSKGETILKDFDLEDYEKYRDKLKARLKKEEETADLKAKPGGKKEDKPTEKK